MTYRDNNEALLLRAEALQRELHRTETELEKLRAENKETRALERRLASTQRELARLRSSSPSPLTVATIVSVLDFVGVGAAALIVNPAWEAEYLMWIALAGAPLTLAAIVYGVHQLINRPMW